MGAKVKNRLAIGCSYLARLQLKPEGSPAPDDGEQVQKFTAQVMCVSDDMRSGGEKSLRIGGT